MASGDDQGRDEGESEFGPPVSGFGPPLNDFGPPAGETGAVGWAPVGEPDRPTLGWQPADAPATPSVPPPPAQYRAPDSAAAPETVRHPAPEAPPAPETMGTPAPETMGTPAPETRRIPEPSHGTDAARAPETVRYPDAGGADADRGTWWRADDSGFPPTPPRETTGSLWDDDELAKKLAPSRPVPGPEPVETGRNKTVLIGGIGAAVVLIVALIVVVVFATSGGGDKSDNAQAGSATNATDDTGCRARTEGNLVYGNGPGDTSSGANAIFGYQHAYYTDRNAEKAHTFIAPGANVQAPPDLQKTIDEHIPKGTTYCLRIATTAPNQFNVEVSEFHPDGTKSLYLEVITTVNQGGRNLIQLIQSF
ncbi:hypothetical protein C5E45_18455 [Nocardia nova]|uniref:DUF8176 domain-containing protein n=1 Tax=Nocardia nova TaxID=37330 RepID=A0A2S6ANE3_9NOCA|nr:hypothetical protein [Nocardia nova]PPJ25235.1 hypothetical protein C5E41_20590 [Nocardia nova]PPJ36791.1 hypothetical protein C5E45_18455 [Nocardia nova]